jgi:hypothetical protein
MSKDILAKYYEGILNQLRGEIDFINEIFKHHGLKGEGNENATRDLIKKFIPNKYGVSSGIVIDREGTPSKQCDIVIYDNTNYPSLLSLTSMHIFPIDLVLATIEIKTTLSSEKAREAVENIKSVRSLDYIEDTFRSHPTEPIFDGSRLKGDAVIWQEKNTIPPIGIIFSYRSSAKKFKTFAKWFNKHDNEDVTSWPTYIFCLDQGYIEVPGRDKENSWASSVIKDGKTWITSDEDEIIEINGAEWAEFSGRLHPLSEYKGEKLFIDQSKLLLHFVLRLDRILAKKSKHMSPNVNFGNEYLNDDYQMFTQIEEE